MKSLRVIVLCLAIIGVLGKFCFCRHYMLKKIEDTEGRLTEAEDAVDVWNLLSRIFEYEESVTVITESYDDNNVGMHNYIRLLQQTKLNLSVFMIDIDKPIIRRPSNLREQNNCREKTKTSYILVMDDNKRYSIFLEKANINAETFNTRARFVIFTDSFSLPDIHETFRTMWKKYHITKVIAFDNKLEEIAGFNFLKDQIKVFNITDIEQILEYTYVSKNNLDGYPMKVSMVHQPPLSIAIPNSTRFHGIDQNIVDTLQSLMNFTAVISQPKLGYGSWEQVISREVELAANMKFMTSHNKSGFEFTSPLFSEGIRVVVPKAERVPVWLSMYRIFDDSVWFPTACLFAVCVVSWLCILKFQRNSRVERLDVGSITINIFFLLTGQPVSRRPENYLERLLVVCGSIFAIIMVSCFSGHLFPRFSEVAYYPDLESFAELEKSGLQLVSASDDVRTALSGSEDRRLIKLFKKLNMRDNETNAFDLKDGVFDHAVLSRLTQANYEEAKNVIENNGSQSLHVMKESLGKFSMGYTVPQGSIFLEQFNHYANIILESGLIQKWYYVDLAYNYTLRMRRAQSISTKDLPRAFTLSDLRLAWFVLAVGLAISFVTFLIELALHSLSVKARGK